MTTTTAPRGASGNLTMESCDVCLDFNTQRLATTTSLQVTHLIDGKVCRRANLCARCAGPGLEVQRLVNLDCVRCASACGNRREVFYRRCRSVLRHLGLLGSTLAAAGHAPVQDKDASDDTSREPETDATYRVLVRRRVERFDVIEVAADSAERAEEVAETLLATVGAHPVRTYFQDYDHVSDIEYETIRRVSWRGQPPCPGEEQRDAE